MDTIREMVVVARLEKRPVEIETSIEAFELEHVLPPEKNFPISP